MVEDSPSQSQMLVAMITAFIPGSRVIATATGAEFRDALGDGQWDACLIDLNLPDVNGMRLLKDVVETTRIPAVVVTASDSVDHAVSAMQIGAVDYVTKPVEQSRLVASLTNAARIGRQAEEIGRLRADLDEAWGVESIIGRSPLMDDVRRLVLRARSSDVAVLITGETGTGKELVARALHYGGARHACAFVDVNSAAMTESLIESELFGHERGSFTGAHARRRGKFEAADQGTLFLDEIGDMPLSTQAKILRVLQEGRLYRTGGEEPVEVDVRVVAATNADLEAAIGEGAFRRDLFYRIATLVIEVPPLRDRPEDIPELAEHFVARAVRRQKRPDVSISPDAMGALMRHDWPGNVRQLEHVMERAVLLCEGGEIAKHDLPSNFRNPASRTMMKTIGKSLISAVEDLERTMIVDALERHGWVKARAARELGVTARILAYKMVSYSIDRDGAADDVS